MKKLIRLGVGVIVFVIVFYHQWALGFNLAIYSILLWFLVVFDPKIKFDKKLIALSIGVWATSLSFAWFGDAFSFFGLFLSLVCMAIYAKHRHFNTILYPLHGITNYLSFFVRIFFAKSWNIVSFNKNKMWKKILLFGLVPFLIVLVFLIVYVNLSSIIANAFNQFFKEFSLWEIIGLSLLGFFFLFNLLYDYIPKEIIRWNNWMKADFTLKRKKELLNKSEGEGTLIFRTSGMIALSLLNILLIIFLFAYAKEQFSDTSTFQVSASRLSNDTHQRVGTVILSIVMAIVLILSYFQSTFNFDKKAGPLKNLTYFWLFLNGLLVLLAFLKTGKYITEYGLTFKRISVLIFLMLCWVGLIFTLIKIWKQKTNIYLINKMARICFVTFIICSCINFSWLVTKYNLSEIKNPDIDYLELLDFNKTLMIKAYKNGTIWQNENALLAKYYLRTVYNNNNNFSMKPFLSSYGYGFYLKHFIHNNNDLFKPSNY